MNFRNALSAVGLTLGMVLAAAGAQAGNIHVLNSSVGGAPIGVSYVNFDDPLLPLGDTGGTSQGVGVTFITDGQTVTGASSGLYAAPYISNSNGSLFGDPTVSGPDATHYVTSGAGAGEVILTFSSDQMYLGLLWGSVDDFNTLSFYDGATLIGSITGVDVMNSPTGDQGVNGTVYVNLNSDVKFNKVIGTSTQHAFEIDNVAYNAINVPEPASMLLLASGILGMVGVRRLRRKAA